MNNLHEELLNMIDSGFFQRKDIKLSIIDTQNLKDRLDKEINKIILYAELNSLIDVLRNIYDFLYMVYCNKFKNIHDMLDYKQLLINNSNENIKRNILCCLWIVKQ